VSDIALTIIDKTGTAHVLTAGSGQNLMHVMREQVDMTIGTCGGEISCGTCVVQLGDGWAGGPVSADEQDMLEALDAGPGCRLACQLSLEPAAAGITATMVAD
jgi:2Fe-2S ferredoxin